MQVSIRAWEEEDAFALHSLSMHPFFTKERILEYFYPDSFLNSMSMIYFYQSADPKRFLFRAIVKDQCVVGSISAQIKKEGTCELSYWLGVAYWRQGIMKEAIRLMCQEVFSKLSVMCMYAVVDEKNIGSQTVLMRNGFQKEQIEHMLLYRLYK